MITTVDDKALAQAAVIARDAAYAPYSGFLVGAALLTSDGTVYTGCNIENAAFTPSICAERVAFSKAVSEGERQFAAIAVAGWPRDSQPDGPAYPCGVCRQVMVEFTDQDKFKVIVVTATDGGIKTTSHLLRELLPHGFGPDKLR